jgi:DNA-binding CsgD family transcriptional regulator
VRRINSFSRLPGYLLVIALILSSIAISIRSRDGEVKLILYDYPFMIFILVLVSSILVGVYFYLNGKKFSDLSDQIKELSKGGDDLNSQLDELTDRQREVYRLIIAGKTNKEIMAELFIEKSTLKSHINQIYKKINITSRRELKSKSKP